MLLDLLKKKNKWHFMYLASNKTFVITSRYKNECVFVKATTTLIDKGTFQISLTYIIKYRKAVYFCTKHSIYERIYFP